MSVQTIPLTCIARVMTVYAERPDRASLSHLAYCVFKA